MRIHVFKPDGACHWRVHFPLGYGRGISSEQCHCLLHNSPTRAFVEPSFCPLPASPFCPLSQLPTSATISHPVIINKPVQVIPCIIANQSVSCHCKLVWSIMQRATDFHFDRRLSPSCPSDRDLAGHQLQGDPGPFWAAAPDLALHFRGGGSQGRRWGPCALSVCCFGPLGSWEDHLHGHPVRPQTRLRSAHFWVCHNFPYNAI